MVERERILLSAAAWDPNDWVTRPAYFNSLTATGGVWKQQNTNFEKEQRKFLLDG